MQLGDPCGIWTISEQKFHKPLKNTFTSVRAFPGGDCSGLGNVCLKPLQVKFDQLHPAFHYLL